MRGLLGTGLVVALLCCPARGAGPKPPPAQALPPVDADKLPPGQFAGVLVSVPDGDRMFTLKVTYPDIQLKPGARMPAGVGQMPHVQNMQRHFQNVQRLQQHVAGGGNHHHVVHNVMQLQQAVLQMQASQQHLAAQEMRLMQQMQQQAARAQQKALQQELRALQRQIKAIQNMYRVVQVTRNLDFQAEENVKVRTAEPPQAFDDKGEIKKYTKEELRELKGKDKDLPGYESSVDNLKVGQTVQVTLAVHKKPVPRPAAKDKDADKDKDKDADKDPTAEHKMQVRLIVILTESNNPGNSTTAPKKKNN